MTITTAGSITSRRWRPSEITWPELVEKLRTPVRTAETMAEYQQMSKAQRGAVKGAAGAYVGGELTGGRRVRAAVKNISLAGAKRYDAENDALPVVLLYIGKRDGTVDLLHTLTPYIISVCPWHNKIMNEP